MFGRLLFRFLLASAGRISVLSFYPFSFKKQFFGMRRCKQVAKDAKNTQRTQRSALGESLGFNATSLLTMKI
jgi:hypothetical protein